MNTMDEPTFTHNATSPVTIGQVLTGATSDGTRQPALRVTEIGPGSGYNWPFNAEPVEPQPDLITFLRARFEEDEDAARTASIVRETATGDTWHVERGRMGVDQITRDTRQPEVGTALVECARHVARHDPARVLGEVAAKRAIVDEHQSEAPEHVYCRICDTLNPWPCWTLRHLAAVYAEHPAYDEAWRP